ncbi:MAG: phosphoribosylformylglycinamidine cyclo-ligase [Clostridia bacterium]|jgi:phosphoribosylformylglycinamidine cyclo-ligase|nr:phosphoribosylformylglycinamidine cyclo-ligase [Clostridia bacterium]MDN5322821.1 phosphoribosylformylglycinamidine cyclo-ligase [Clostridia bacterium]
MCSDQGLSYSQAGVDIDKGNEAVELIKPLVKSTFRPEVLTELGGFGGLFALDTSRYQEPILVSGTDGVGTKLKIAFQMNKHDTIGIDAVAMCVNDIVVSGAEPLFFLDYLAVGKLEPAQVTEIIKGIAEGCRQAGCALIGGETAEMPGFYPPGEYDVAGFVVGVVDKAKIIDGRDIRPGDIILGLPSTGLHSNGFSLARKVFLDRAGYSLEMYIPQLEKKLGDVLLEPTRIYVSLIQKLISSTKVKGLAHITGGGLTENMPRILPKGCQAVINKNIWPVLPVFKLIKELGQVAEDEMYRTFNMGIGMVIIADEEEAEKIKRLCRELGEQIYSIGFIEKGETRVCYREEVLKV